MSLNQKHSINIKGWSTLSGHPHLRSKKKSTISLELRTDPGPAWRFAWPFGVVLDNGAMKALKEERLFFLQGWQNDCPSPDFASPHRREW